MQVDLITSRYIMIGLNAVGDNSTNSYTDIDYGFYFNNNNSNVRIYENGSSKGVSTSITSTDDVFMIKRKALQLPI